MGLDTVELIKAVEEEFGIEIPNKDASNLATLGDLKGYVIRALRTHGESSVDIQIWNRLSAVVVRQLSVRPDEVTRSEHMVRDLHAD
jgi:acyl carrier protein